PRRGPAGLTNLQTWLWLVAGWVAWPLVFLVLAAAGWPAHRYQWAATASAEAAWLAVVLLANALDERRESITNTPEAGRPSRQGRWRLRWGPVLAALVGLALGWAWK